MRYGMLFFLFALISSCGLKQEKAGKEVSMNEYLEKGEEIIELSQAELLKNVGKAMGEGGPGNAVDFCSIHALSIKDSLSAKYGVEIRRITNKYRNPQDQPRTDTEMKVLDGYQSDAKLGKTLQAEVHSFNNRIEYYHPIFVSNGACLLCHGTPGEDISGQTQEMIQTHYPDDLATGFALNDFRGVWKITFIPD